MMLQINPSLTPDDAKNIINLTAITDAYTGTLPTSGTVTWGHGKINAYGAVNYLIQHESVKSLHMNPLDCILYPNPNHGTFTLNYTSKTQELLKIEITDVTGRIISSQVWPVNNGSNSRQFSLNGMVKGIYFTKISSIAGYNVIRMAVE
jgi:hypothetical protein